MIASCPGSCSSVAESRIVINFGLSGAVIGSYAITVSNANGSSNIWYFNVVPEILFGGADITGPAQSAVVGEQIALTTIAPLPSGVTITALSWTVPGTSTGGFPGNTPLMGIPVPGGPLHTDSTQASITFFWADAAFLRVVQYQATLSTGETTTSSALFNVVSPTMPVDASQLGANQIVAGANGASSVVLTGVPIPGFVQNVGILFSPAVTPPPGYTGDFQFVQLVDNFNIYSDGPPAPACSYSGLDVWYPYLDTLPQNQPPLQAYDSPGAGLPAAANYFAVSATFAAHMYIMWQPNLPASIPVPLGNIAWGWSGYAISQGGVWLLDLTDPINKPNSGFAGPFVASTLYLSWVSIVPYVPLSAASMRTTMKSGPR
jgi:hypothetical protein